MVIADRTIALEHVLDNLLTINSIFQRKAYIVVVCWRTINHQRHIHERATFRLQHFGDWACLNQTHSLWIEIKQHVDVAGDQRVNASSDVAYANHLNLVDPRSIVTPVVLISHKYFVLSRYETLNFEWPGTR